MNKKHIGICVAVLGVVVLLAAVISTGVILSLAPEALKNSAQMKIDGESGYDAFIDTRPSGNDDDAVPLYYEYTFFNISNVNEMIDATNPTPAEVEEIGPFVYREYCTRNNVTTDANNDAIEYSELCWKEYQPELSVDAITGQALAEDTPLHNIYYTYYGVLDLYGKAKEPATFMFGAIQQVLEQLFASLMSSGGGIYTEDSIAMLLYNKTDPSVALVPRVRDIANLAGTNLNFDFESDLFVTHVTVPTISAFDQPMAKAFLFGAAGISNTTEACDSLPCSAYFIGVSQKVGQLMQAAADEGFDPTGTNTMTLKGTMNAFGNANYGFPLIDGTDAGTLSTQLQDGIKYYQYFSSYITYITGHYFGLAFAENHSYAGDAANANSLTASHYFTQRTPREFLFGFQDDAFAGRLHHQVQGSLFSFTECPKTFNAHGHDNTAPLDYGACYNEWQDTPFYSERYRQLTGRHNIEDVEKITLWRSQDTLPTYDPETREGYWCAGDVPVIGRRNPNGPSASVRYSSWAMNPVVNNDYKMMIWNADTLRNVSLSYVRDGSVRGVETKQLTVDEENYDPARADYRFEIQEYGVFNMTCPKGAPFYLTFPHFLLSSFTTNDDLILPNGVRAPDAVKDAVLIDVEPLTGKTIKADFKLQINMRIPSGIPGFTGSVEDGRDVVFPIVYLQKRSQLSEKDASALRTVHNALFNVPKPVLIVGCVFGPALFALGLLLVSMGKKAEAEAAARAGASPTAGAASLNSDVGYVRMGDEERV